MFTGIIEDKGKIVAIQDKKCDRRFKIKTDTLDLSALKEGDSIAVNGVCLTIFAIKKHIFSVDISAETLSCTTFSKLIEGQYVNLECALMPSSRLSGHLVSGHIDGIGSIEDIHTKGQSICAQISAPITLMKYIVKKGSICIDGVSLTVNKCTKNVFYVNIIPHTFTKTVFSNYSVGTQVNIEIDLIMRYLEGLLRQ